MERICENCYIDLTNAEVEGCPTCAHIQYENELKKEKEKFKSFMESQLEEIENDERLSYPPADIMINAPLAMIQMGLKVKQDSLKLCLKKFEEICLG